MTLAEARAKRISVIAWDAAAIQRVRRAWPGVVALLLAAAFSPLLGSVSALPLPHRTWCVWGMVAAMVPAAARWGVVLVSGRSTRDRAYSHALVAVFASWMSMAEGGRPMDSLCVISAAGWLLVAVWAQYQAMGGWWAMSRR